ncbi:MAG: 30S ribosomal protein S16 [Lentisphaerae bacterium]|nr:30S ribosomal protein S16 [Lentisphaerota bacterium]
MAVKIRCQRTGANNDPSFRIVAADTRAPRDGKALEILGWYNPQQSTGNFYLRLERIEAWQQKGAQLSGLVRSLLKQAQAGAMAAPPTPGTLPTSDAPLAAVETPSS